MTRLRSIPPLVFIVLGAAVVFGLPLLFHLYLQPRYHVLDGRPVLDVALKVLPWTCTLIVWWATAQGERNVRDILRLRGVVAPATVTWIRDEGSEERGVPVVELFVRVTPDGGTPFDASVKARVPQGVGEPLRPGTNVRVRYDPQNPTSFIRLEESQSAPAGEAMR